MPPHSTVPARRTAPPRPSPGATPSSLAARVRRIATAGAAVVGLAALGEAGMRGAMAYGSGQSGIGHALAIVTFYAGVCALVALSLTVAAGLLATDRILLAVRQRIWVQSAHRTLSMLAVVFLGLHILTEIASSRIGAVAAVVPFVAASAYLGLGTVAAYLLAMVAWTGLVRARFAGAGRPWVWRALHAVAYACWPIALLHGLLGGRPPAVWVTAAYLLLVLAVLVALVVRLLAERARRVRSRPQRGLAVTESVRVFQQSHPARGRATVDAHSAAAGTYSELPTLVDLQAARGLRRGSRAQLAADAHYRTALRGEAR